MVKDVLSDTLSRFKDLTAKPDVFLEPDNEAFKNSKLLLKSLYDYTKMYENTYVEKDRQPYQQSTLPQLIINGFNEEQVWAGIELQNKAYADLFAEYIEVQCGGCDFNQDILSTISNHADVDDVKSKDEDSNFPDVDISDVESSCESTTEANLWHTSEGDSDADANLPLFEDKDSDDEKEENIDLSEHSDVNDQEDSYMKEAMKNLHSRKCNVDDDFFKLSQMESFLEAEETRDKRQRMLEGRQVNEDDMNIDDVDIFEDIPDANNEAFSMYADYFADDPNPTNIKSNSIESSHKIPEEEETNNLSSFEKRKVRFLKHVATLEDEALSEKPWQLRGEIQAPDRPKNSLLTEYLDYESGARRAPIITEAISQNLEDIIKQRIKDLAWDDVERKIKPLEDPQEYKRRLVLNQEKSKLSLAQVYEEEYLSKLGKHQKNSENSSSVIGMLRTLSEDETPKEVKDIRIALDKLMAKLDVLSHFHFTPSSSLNAEVKIVKNLPSLALEEVAPIAASDATLLAPQEISTEDRKLQNEIGSLERTSTDRKRERRKKKLIQSKRFKMKGNITTSKSSLSSAVKAVKHENLNQLALKSSTAFFSKLQDEVSSKAVKEKKSEHKRSFSKYSSSGLKL